MNERIRSLIEEVVSIEVDPDSGMETIYTCGPEDFEAFAELIIRECANTIENRTPGQMGKEGEGWTNGYDDGLKTSAFLIKKHFGVE